VRLRVLFVSNRLLTLRRAFRAYVIHTHAEAEFPTHERHALQASDDRRVNTSPKPFAALCWATKLSTSPHCTRPIVPHAAVRR
jgi:hypothetical protein